MFMILKQYPSHNNIRNAIVVANRHFATLFVVGWVYYAMLRSLSN